MQKTTLKESLKEEQSLKLKLFGEPILRRKAKAVKQITDWHSKVLSQMAQIMYAHKGIGLAGPQVGIDEALIVVDIGNELYKLINPKIIKKEGTQVMEEGCLSIPEVSVRVRRAKKIKVLAQDESGRSISIEAENLLACVFQHEIDHLKGKLIVDYASFWERLKMKKKLKELEKRLKDEKLSQSETKSCKL